MPDGDSYFELVTSQFANWRLTVDGLVRKKLSLSLDEIKKLPARTQITQHSCDEGWSAIGQWTGVPLGHLLQMAELAPQARYIVFHCLDEMTEGEFYYESIDLFDAFHPQTILAYGMNGKHCRSITAHRSGCASSARSATRTPNTSPASRPSTGSTLSAAAKAASGKTAAINGMRGCEQQPRPQPRQPGRLDARLVSAFR